MQEMEPVRVIVHGEQVIQVNAADFEAARAHDRANPDAPSKLAEMFAEVVDELVLDTNSIVVDNDGVVSQVCGVFDRFPDRISVMGGRVTDAVTAILAAATPGDGCDGCEVAVCSRHLAEALLQAARAEGVYIIPVLEGDAILNAAVKALAGTR